jgi:hypothetical protein
LKCLLKRFLEHAFKTFSRLRNLRPLCVLNMGEFRLMTIN